MHSPAIMIIVVLIGVCLFPLLLLAIRNPVLPKWACTRMGWHLAPRQIGFNGCSLEGTCPRCAKHVLQDSQGNWF
jgi:hypothetical protein